MPAAPLPADAWTEMLAAVRHHRVLGFLQSAIEDGVFPATDEQAEQVEDAHLQAMIWGIHLERRLLRILDVLETGGVEAVVLKGTSSAHLMYPDPAVRTFNDNDLLFRSEQFDDAMGMLVATGYRRLFPPTSPAFDRHFGKGATLRGRGGDELDAHRNLVFATFGLRIELDELFRSSRTFVLGGHDVRTLGAETRLLHACYHAALGDPDPRLSSLRDVAQLLAFGTHSIPHVQWLAHQWRAQAVLARAFRLCRQHLDLEVGGPLVDWAERHESTRAERRAIEAYVGRNRHHAVKLRASLPFLPGPRTKLRFVRAALPSSGFVEQVGQEPRRSWLLRGVRAMFDV
ncbi:nucleotidyltransferase family protein [Egicoccus halophilus]